MSNETECRATQVEEGWRKDTEERKRRATEVEEGWRKDTEERKRKATEVEEGWRKGTEEKKRRVTEVDEGWRKEGASPELTDVMIDATANYFGSIEEFKNAVEKLSTLTSSEGNVFSVKKTISRVGGESIVLLCSNLNGEDVVAKVYFEPVDGAGSSITTRSRVIEYMKTEEGKKYTLAVTEIGLVGFGDSKYYFEIMPYCANADLSVDGTYSFERIVEITRQLNEALYSIHGAGIIHRDIKPENMYEIDGRIKLGDFGIAKAVVGRSNVTEHILGTEGYTAPETRRYIFHEKSDYYSLGVTLATLFEGHFVFENMSFEMQSLAQESERIPLRREDPNREQLENLLNGLCRLNAKQRFGYEEVNKWLDNHEYTGADVGDEWSKTYYFLGNSYRDEKSLFFGITQDLRHWDEAKETLYTKLIEQFFASFRTDIARAAQVADELYHMGNRDKGLSIFLKTLYAPGPIVWKGYTFNSLSELADKMVVAKTPASYSELLQNHCISHWLNNTEGITVKEETRVLVDKIEELSVTEPEIACYWFGNSFAANKKMTICDHEVVNIEQLINAMFSSPNDFYQKDGYDKLLNKKTGADLYGFLYSFGYKEVVDKEWEHLNSCDWFNRTVILFSMLEHIATKESVNPTLIRHFFVDYGPIGAAIYARHLATRIDNPVYVALDAEGKRLLGNIVGFKQPDLGSVDDMFKAYTPLMESIDKLRRNLIENPHCILAGVYESKGVICTNLVGCFAFKIMGRLVPLGFSAMIENADGGLKQ